MLRIKESRKNILKLLLINLIIYLIFVFSCFIFIHQILTNDSKNFIENVENKIKASLIVDGNKWDTSLYNSDPHTPYPNASTTFPVYIFTKEGYVIERSRPITGYLDTSDYKHLVQFISPTTINTTINETWRVQTTKIISEGSEVGVIFMAYYNPPSQLTNEIDEQLKENIRRLNDQLKFENGNINLNNLDERKVDYNLSFEIVSKSNKVLLTNGRVPSFIDPSYVENEPKDNKFRIISDSNTREKFLVKSIPILDAKNESIGLVAVGRSIEYIDNIKITFLLLFSILGIIFVPSISYFLNKFIESEIKIQLQSHLDIEAHREPQNEISFQPDACILLVDDKSHAIVYASNQFYLLKNLFNKPHKRFENDELLEEFGEEVNEHNYKKVYDTAVAINKKLEFKLILYQDRTFKINPSYLNLIKSNSK